MSRVKERHHSKRIDSGYSDTLALHQSCFSGIPDNMSFSISTGKSQGLMRLLKVFLLDREVIRLKGLLESLRVGFLFLRFLQRVPPVHALVDFE